MSQVLGFAPGEDGKGTGQEKAARVTGEGSAASFPARVGDSRCKASGTGTGAASNTHPHLRRLQLTHLRHMCFGNRAAATEGRVTEADATYNLQLMHMLPLVMSGGRKKCLNAKR